MASEHSVILMNKQRIVRSLARMAFEIAERNPEDRPIVFFGIGDGGLTIAKKIAEQVRRNEDMTVQTFHLDLDNTSHVSSAAPTFQDFDNPLVIIVDDVIFSGRTMFEALKTVSSAFTPSEIKTAALIDRGTKHRRMPVACEFCGLRVATKHYEHVSVELTGGDRNVVKIIRSAK